MPYQDREHIKQSPAIFKTFVGLASGTVATSLVHPYDLLKTRMQLSTRNVKMVPLAKCIVQHEGGCRSLYKGLTAALARNVTNTSVRLGAFYTLSEQYRKKYDNWPSLYDNVVIGIASGVFGAFTGTPAEVVGIRMMGDGRMVRPGMWSCDRYSNVANGMKRILKTEGVPGLWRGGLLTLLRSVMVSTVHIYCYKKTHQAQKDYYTSLQVPPPSANKAPYKLDKVENMKTHFVTSIVASFFTSAFTLPVDLVKTRLNERTSTGTTVWNGVMAGALGAVVGNPAELVLVRMMGDGTQGRSCPCQPVRYRSICDGIKKITACEGRWGLWRGTKLSVLRSAIISSSQIYAYTKTKQMFEGDAALPKKKTSDKKTPAPKNGGIMLHLVTAMLTSFCSAFLSLPVDLVKTWYMYLTPNPCYTPANIFKDAVQCRGYLFLWKGFLPYYLRMFTHTFITFLLLDRLCSSYESGTINPFSSSSSSGRSSGFPKKWTPWD